MEKQIFIIIGPPGSGKGTQAELLADELRIYYFETSKIIEEKFNNASPDDAELMSIKKEWESGKINNPLVVREWVVDKVKSLYDKEAGIVFAGSPRTLIEAERLTPFLEELYGFNNIKIIKLELTAEESFKRNTNRRICIANRHPIPDLPEFKNITKCPKDGSDLVKRKGLDDPETLAVRDKEYKERTAPIFDYLINRGYKIIDIKGEQPIEKVHADILSALYENQPENSPGDTDYEGGRANPVPNS